MAGGIERMATALMNDMCEREHDVSLLTWDLAQANAFYEFDNRIKWYNLNLGGHKEKAGWALRFKRMQKMRSLLKDIQPDVIMAFQHGTFISTRLYLSGLGFPIIAAEREAPARFEHLKAGKWQWLIYQSFRLATRITIQCESYRNDYPAYLRHKIKCIPNPVFPASKFSKPAGLDQDAKILLCVGRLGYQKNQTILIQAFSMICDAFPNWSLHLAGEGGDRSTLETQIKDLGLTKRVILLGAVQDVSELYCTSHLLCLPSRWEGFPNVVAESLSHGLPVVGFEQCAGTRDLIEDSHNGLLANGNNDAASLADTLNKAMTNDLMRAAMGEEGRKSMAAFSPRNIFDQWEAFFKEITDR